MATPGRSTRKPTLETVAARAGVSRSLVSLVLHDSPKVSAASREAVMQAVTELGYRPNAAARLLAERRSHTIGVLLNDLRQPWFADMLDGLTPGLHAGGKHILLGDGRIDRMLDETLTWSFLDLGVDGLVLAGSIPMSQAIVDAASQIPTVAVGGRGLDVDLPRADILANDNHLGGTLAVRHLVELGHTRIAHIHGLPSVAGRLRMQGYEDTMRDCGLGGNIRIEAGDMSEEGGYRAAVRLLSGPDRPTAIFAANDLTCVGALSAAAALGVRVPAEVSLVGFDNSVFARLRALWLTSVDATAFEMGQRAARMLLARIERPGMPGQTVLLPPKLEVRGSSGPAPAKLSLRRTLRIQTHPAHQPRSPLTPHRPRAPNSIVMARVAVEQDARRGWPWSPSILPYSPAMTTTRRLLAPLRPAARILTGSTYVLLGFDALRAPGARVDQAAPVLAAIRKGVPLPEDDELVVRANAAVMVVAGAMLAMGRAPRLSALALAGSLIPTTLAGHSYWKVEDPDARKIQRIQFHKNMAMIGGLLFAALDEP